MEIATRRREQEVWQACDDLWSLYGEIQGLTGEAIREKLVHSGKSRGSPNEIYKYRKTWMKSRNLERDTSFEPNENANDPITRAVKLVHDQLQTETNEQIQQLKIEFEALIQNKEEEVSKATRALDAVMTEFKDLEHQLDESNAEIKILKDEKEAEIAVRKALERELTMLKALREQENHAHETMINELKNSHLLECKRALEREREREQRQNEKITLLIEEKKQLGFSYSEKLIELKTIIHNNDFVHKQIESKLIDLRQERDHLLATCDAKNKQIEMLKEEHNQISNAYSALSAEARVYLSEKHSLRLEIKNYSHLLKKSALTIAHLRAVMSTK